MSASAKNQVERNYQAFVEELPALYKTHPGKFALMHDGKVVNFFNTVGDAYFAGLKMFEQEGQFSVQEVVTDPVDLGYYSHALP